MTNFKMLLAPFCGLCRSIPNKGLISAQLCYMCYAFQVYHEGLANYPGSWLVSIFMYHFVDSKCLRIFG